MKIVKMNIAFAFLISGNFLFLSGCAIMIFPDPFCQSLSVFVPLFILVMGGLMWLAPYDYLCKRGYEKETRNLQIFVLFAIQFFGIASSYERGGQWNIIIRILLPLPVLAAMIYYANQLYRKITKDNIEIVLDYPS